MFFTLGGVYMTEEYMEYLAHYGVKGQKWGQRQWQNEDGTYTEAGKQHYGWGYGRPRDTRMPQTRHPSSPGTKGDGVDYQPRNNRTSFRPSRPQRVTQEEIEARKRRARTIVIAAAGITLTAAAAYAAYRKGKAISGRYDEYKNMLNSKSRQWDMKSRNFAREHGIWPKKAEKAFWKYRRRQNRSALNYLLTGKR
jgi:hypothetical protein